MGDQGELNCNHWLEGDKLARNFMVASLGSLGLMVVLGRTRFRKSKSQGWHFCFRGIAGNKAGVAPKALTSQSRWAAAKRVVEHVI